MINKNVNHQHQTPTREILLSSIVQTQKTIAIGPDLLKNHNQISKRPTTETFM